MKIIEEEIMSITCDRSMSCLISPGGLFHVKITERNNYSVISTKINKKVHKSLHTDDLFSALHWFQSKTTAPHTSSRIFFLTIPLEYSLFFFADIFSTFQLILGWTFLWPTIIMKIYSRPSKAKTRSELNHRPTIVN